MTRYGHVAQCSHLASNSVYVPLRASQAVNKNVTWAGADGGTDLLAVHDGVIPGVPPAENEAGWREALGKLAALVEDEFKKGRLGA